MQVAYLKYFCFWIGILTTQTSDDITYQNLESGKKNKEVMRFGFAPYGKKNLMGGLREFYNPIYCPLIFVPSAN